MRRSVGRRVRDRIVPRRVGDRIGSPLTRPKPLARDKTTRYRQCVDCKREGITSKRKTPYPGPRCASHSRVKRKERRDMSWEKRIEATYGITPEEYWKIFDHQNGRCYICRRGNGARKRLSVDHCHRTGLVRGLLDTGCNKWVLGLLRDDVDALQRAIDYLNHPPATEVIGWRIVPSTGAPVQRSTELQDGAKPTIIDIGDAEPRI